MDFTLFLKLFFSPFLYVKLPSLLSRNTSMCLTVFSNSLDITFSEMKMNILLVLLIVCASAATYCFIVGEITGNTSQMDKLWSILPIAYAWIIAGMSGMNWRCVVIAIITTLWGIRLTMNFARKGAYSWKFWSGVEDYRWAILRKKKPFNNRFVWAIFDLLFISIYQNLLVLLITLPSLMCVESTAPFSWIDFVAGGIALLALAIETIADEEQWKFQTTKYKMLKEGKKLEELPLPYSKGFNTVGLWGRSRHPNYLGEQSIWVGVYIFSISALVGEYGITGVFNLSGIGALLLILLFIGSTILAENISKGKYPEYSNYQKKVSVYIPWKKYKD